MYFLDSQAQLDVLSPLVVPKRLVHGGWKKTDKSEEDGEGEAGQLNQTDQEKSVAKDTASLLEVGDSIYVKTLRSIVHTCTCTCAMW